MKTLREWREARGFTQLDIAFGLGITPTTVANWETGDSMNGPVGRCVPRCRVSGPA
jgi:transcriptional regulator with XRE-family HTH domain